jgi:urease accessory protein
VSATTPLGPDRVGRDGTLRLRFERRGSESIVAGCRYTLPLQTLAPVALGDPAAVVSILNPTGGLVGGDRLSIEVEATAGAHAVLTTPSATRVYRTDGAAAIQSVKISIGPQAAVEWVPDHTIPFASSAFRQTLDVEMDEHARLILVDSFSAGRVGRGEAWQFSLLDSAVSIRDRQGWLLHDRLALRGPMTGRGTAWDGLGSAESHPYFATIAIVGCFDRERFADDLGRQCPGVDAGRIGVAVLARRGLLIRCLAPSAPELLDTIEACRGLARQALLGLPPLALRKG